MNLKDVRSQKDMVGYHYICHNCGDMYPGFNLKTKKICPYCKHEYTYYELT